MKYTIIEKKDVIWAATVLKQSVFLSPHSKEASQHMRDKALFIFREWKKQPNYRSIFDKL